MSTAIILAGGRSSRSGRIHKGLRTLNCAGQPISWLEYQIQQLRRAGFSRIVLATGFRPRPLLNKAAGTQQTHNPNPAHGPFSTLQQALKGFISQQTLLVPLDNPVPAPAVLFRIRRALQNKRIAKPCYQGRGGHPLLLSKAVVQHLLKVDPAAADARLDHQLRRLAHKDIARVGVTTPLVRTNLNNQRQWTRYKSAKQGT